uniref:Uncharacterized protein n=1 Tax=Romanomermis culicivorax TaxID=13658 RepID=A0A915KI41_ROMCU
FPLFTKESDKIVFNYAVFLLNKNIAQLRYEFGLSTSDLRETLANIRSLLGCLAEAKIDYRFLRKPLRVQISPYYSGANISYSCSNTSLFSEPTSDPDYNLQSKFLSNYKNPTSEDLNFSSKYSNSCNNISKICTDLTTDATNTNNDFFKVEELPMDEKTCIENLRNLNIRSPNKHKFMENCRKLLKTCYLSSEKLNETCDFESSTNGLHSQH